MSPIQTCTKKPLRKDSRNFVKAGYDLVDEQADRREAAQSRNFRTTGNQLPLWWRMSQGGADCKANGFAMLPVLYGRPSCRDSGAIPVNDGASPETELDHYRAIFAWGKRSVHQTLPGVGIKSSSS
jgi:hypothetical protein